MKQKVVKDFLLDHIAETVAFFSASSLICVFYSIVSGKRMELLYPFSIVFFIYIIWMGLRFIEYFKLYRTLEDMEESTKQDSNLNHQRSKHVISTINRLHYHYQDKLAINQNLAQKERRFLSLWIHNMKTPVTVTDVLLQRVEQEDMDALTAMQALKEENKKLLNHLDTILNMIKLQEFGKDYVPEPINLLEEVTEIINKNKNQFISHHVFPKIVNELEETKILSDRKWNELLIGQLISNGIKYSKNNQEKAQTLYFIFEKQENHIVLTIKDEGIGIPEHDLGKVCEPFFTGDNGRKGYHSSGIGLYFCKEVCRLLGHTMSITSQVEEGTLVRISYLAKL